MQFDPFIWRQQFENLPHSNTHARRSWEDLLSTGCAPDWLAYSLALSCDFDGAPGRSQIASMRRRLSSEPARVLKNFTKRLQTDRDTLVDVFHEEGVLITALDEFISRMKFIVEVSSLMGSARVMNPSIYLALLVGTFRAYAGRPYYTQIAALLDVAYEAFGKELGTAAF